MSITVLWRTVRGRWHDLMQQLWPEGPEERTRAEITRLSRDLCRRWRRLIRLRQRIDKARARAAALSPPNEASAAAAERLARLEQAYRNGCSRLRRRKRLCAALARGQMQVVEVIHGPGRSQP